MKTRGFTLVEMLIALFIFALISVLAYRATSAMTDGEARLAQESAHWRLLEQLFSRMEADIQQALPRTLSENGQAIPAWTGTRDAQGRVLLQFARAPSRLASPAGTPMGQRVAYEWTNGALDMVYWPAFDQSGNDSSQHYRLLNGVRHFRLDYLTRNGEWVESWPQEKEPALPRAVRVQIAADNAAPVERIFVLQ